MICKKRGSTSVLIISSLSKGDVLVSTDRAYTGTAQTPVGILNDLYLDIQIDKAKDVITIVTSTTNKNLCIGQPPVVKPDAYTGFDIHWIPLFKAMLLAESFEEMTYSELDSSFTDIVSEKSFNNIVNWLKTN